MAASLAGIGDAYALGLGEIRTRSSLGEPFLAEVDVLTSGREPIDVACFRLGSAKADSDLPWLRRASFQLRKGASPVLEVRSEQPLRDPVLQVGILVGCGHEVRRDYTLFLSPRGKEVESPLAEAPAPVQAPPAILRRQVMPPMPKDAAPVARKALPPKAEKRSSPLLPPSDRLFISSGAGDPSLQLAAGLSAVKEGSAAGVEAQRDLLRQEFKMLMALQEQATSQLAAAEKLRNMEGTLADLQARAGNFAQRMEKGVASAGAPASPPAASAGVPGEGKGSEMPAARTSEKAGGLPLTEWSFYGGLLGAVLGLAGWLGWRQYRQRAVGREDFRSLEPLADPIRLEEAQQSVNDDFHARQAAVAAAPVQAKPSAEEGQAPPPAPAPSVAPEAPRGGSDSSLFSVSGATVDEHFEASPVMELADIMLSFGRVKGAAQALQEFIDHNPQEALQPWLRLMDVYRMAGMREEFDRLAMNLHRQFNVEVQQWDPSQPSAGEKAQDAQPVGDKAFTLEDIGRLRDKVVSLWGTPECQEFLHELLRDNRGGERLGFTLPVVEEILFLIELADTRALLDKQT